MRWSFIARNSIVAWKHRANATPKRRFLTPTWPRPSRCKAEYTRLCRFTAPSLVSRLQVFGELHTETAQSYMNLGSCYRLQGKITEALVFVTKGLDISLKTVGEQHLATAYGCAHVASCLKSQGKLAEAVPFYRKCLDIFEKLAGQTHPDTGLAYNNVGNCLQLLGQTEEALTFHRKAREAYEKSWGPFHPYTANSYLNTAACLKTQGKAAEALAMYEKALATRLKLSGELHSDTATNYHLIASCLEGKTKAVQALDFHRKALAIRLKLLGGQHPATGESYFVMANCLRDLDKTPEAVDAFEKALLGVEFGRLSATEKGFDRARYLSFSPQASLAALLVRLEENDRAWQEAESGLGRGLLDALAGPATLSSEQRVKLSRLNELETASLPLLKVRNPSESQQHQLTALTQQKDRLRLELARVAVHQVRGRVLSRAAIQKHIPPDAAIVFWLDVPRLGEHLGCVLRATRGPAWVRLPGSGTNDTWTAEDDTLPRRAFAALADRFSDPVRRMKRIEALHKQRLAPLEPHLQGVRQLLVIPSGEMVALPLEALSTRYTVSYISSASIFARNAHRSRPLSGKSVLVLADPAFTRTNEKQPPPPHGLSLRGDHWLPLPGTRLEGAPSRRWSKGATVLLGSDANEERLNQMALSDELKRFRLLHLATHGEVSSINPNKTALILAQDRLPSLDSAARETLGGKTPRTGRLTVGTILNEWNLDADLVTLSACQSGLGQQTQGEGLLGFAHALMEKGARSVLLSRWKVDDEATALLMRRFYQNVLGKREGLAAPLGRAEALKEAKTWLRRLERKETEKLLVELTNRLPPSERSKVRPPIPANKTGTKSKGDRPFEHPYFWAAFVLVGDPR